MKQNHLLVWLFGVGLGCEEHNGDNVVDTTIQDLPPEPYAFQHLQALGSHNSYHIETEGNGIPDWDYTHPPLDQQLDLGVRQFELDTSYDTTVADYRVFHVPLLDEQTTCPTLTECTAVLYQWSKNHPLHHPLFVLIETKLNVAGDEPQRLDWLDQAFLSAAPREWFITPAEIQGEYQSLREAIETEGWPTFNHLRGRALLVLHDGGERRELYLQREDPLLFPDAAGDLLVDYAATHTINDAVGQFALIGEAVNKNHLVRTRTDSGLVYDSIQREQALASGAQFVSTDFIDPSHEYYFTLPDGTPSRCNPLTADDNCTSELIENLSQ